MTESYQFPKLSVHTASGSILSHTASIFDTWCIILILHFCNHQGSINWHWICEQKYFYFSYYHHLQNKLMNTYLLPSQRKECMYVFIYYERLSIDKYFSWMSKITRYSVVKVIIKHRKTNQWVNALYKTDMYGQSNILHTIPLSYVIIIMTGTRLLLYGPIAWENPGNKCRYMI